MGTDPVRPTAPFYGALNVRDVTNSAHHRSSDTVDSALPCLQQQMGIPKLVGIF